MPDNKNEQEFEIVFSRTGTAIVKAVNLYEAMRKANELTADQVTWDDDFAVTDGDEHDPYGTEGD